jgi:hypothetical protein
MKKGITYPFLIVIFLLTLSFKQYDHNTLLWKADRPLTWDDFNGMPEKRFAAASTHYDILKHIHKDDDKNATVKIEAVFFRHESWKKKEWINDEVLAHEQKHFDIVELYARKLRKALKETTFKNFNELEVKLGTLYDKFDKEMDAYQDKYDEESDGSMNGDQQRVWNKKIAKEISELDPYKETAVKIKF